MSVLIKHMAMPKGCIYANDKDQTEYCPMLNHDDVPFCQYIENEPETAIGIDERPVYCPLSDVPDTNVGDIISRQAAIDALIEYGNGRVVYISVEEAVRRIEQLPPNQPEPHWIPVTKDLPKESGHYIVTTRTVCLPINLLHPELDRYSNNVRIDYFRAYENKFDLPSTVAWWSEPLPNPYEEVTE